jgi:hypothetical protein
LQSFIQGNYHFTEKLTLVAGMHFLSLADNNTNSIEPRMSLKYEITPSQSVSLGYGLHSQVQPLGVYFVEQVNAEGEIVKPNRNLEFSKSQHAVLAYERSLNEYLHVKAEFYYQHLYNIPISVDQTSTYSILNQEEGYTEEILTNKGLGRNAGVELTLEHFMRKDLYFLFSASLFDSKYKAANGEWYNTRYNNNYNFSFTGGKEIKTGEKFRNRILGFNLKTVYSGGKRETPINEELSKDQGYTVYYEDQAFKNRMTDYFRADIRISLKRNRPKSTVTWALDVQNITNHQNVYGRFFDPQIGETKTYYQTSIIPILSYKIDF